jgi:hypothetical protein
MDEIELFKILNPFSRIQRHAEAHSACRLQLKNTENTTMIKTSAQRMEEALASFAAGKSLRECEKLHGTNYKKLEREAKKRVVEKGCVSYLIDAKANLGAELSQIIETQAKIDVEVSQLPLETQKVISKEAALRQKHIEFFNQAALINVKQAMASACTGQQEYRNRAETISKGRETVLGRSPDSAVQINNSISLEELLADL